VTIADTGAIVALIDADDRHHAEMVELFDRDRGAWLLPWAILPEVDYLVSAHVGEASAEAFRRDLAQGAFAIEWGQHRDLMRARALCDQYASLRLGLVDAVVMAIAERMRATAIATFDLRDFGPVTLEHRPRLIPRDR